MHQKKRGRVPSYDESIQGHPNKKKGKERKDKRERGKREGRGQVPSYEQASKDTPGRGVNLSITFRNTPTSEGGGEGGWGEEGD